VIGSHLRLAQSRRRLLALCHSRAQEENWDQALLQELLQLLSDPAWDSHQRRIGSSHSFIVEKCHRMALFDTMDAPSVMDLCQQLQVSRRTVQNSFRSVAETTPLHYLRSVRLNGVRRALMRACGAELSIGDAAAQWGFFHLSHFAGEYQMLFAQLPSQTARVNDNLPP